MTTTHQEKSKVIGQNTFDTPKKWLLLKKLTEKTKSIYTFIIEHIELATYKKDDTMVSDKMSNR
jgi:DNA polymerase III delta prime subunit